MQLLLDLKLKCDATFDNFMVGENEVVVNVLKAFAEEKGDPYCFVWSHPGDGLSHLLQAICHRAKENMYLPLAELKVFGPDFLEGIDSVPLVCIDDIHVVAGDAAWEEALFHTFNRIHERGHRLIFGAHHVAAECGFQLKDLLSRIASGASYSLLPLKDDDKMQLLQHTAKRRGFNLPIEVARYLLAHYPRDMRTQLSILEKLDFASLQEKHKVTLPFVKSALLSASS
ncbi:MAG: DnaA regulatory inactivator Hda [Pseudomonadota bacterium]